jgi:transposase
VFTTAATVADVVAGSFINEYLDEKGYKPEESYVDGGYISAEHLVESEAIGIKVIGPSYSASNWQSKVEGGIDIEDFQINWEKKYAECPGGKRSTVWREGERNNRAVIRVQFKRDDCMGCPLRAKCTRSETTGRSLSLREKEVHDIVVKSRLKSKEDATKLRYQIRSGIESAISQGVRGFGLRFNRYIGIEKTSLQHVLTAAAMNMQRLVSWWQCGQQPARQRPPVALKSFITALA